MHLVGLSLEQELLAWMLDELPPFPVLVFLLVFPGEFAERKLNLCADYGSDGIFGGNVDVVEAHVDRLQLEVLHEADSDVEHLFVNQLTVRNIKVTKLRMVDDHPAHMGAKITTVVLEGAVR